jgi:signal transduction histidine kinase
MNISYIISCAITGTLSFLIGIFVYLKNRHSNINKIWMLVNFGVALWCWSLFGRELSFEKTSALFFIRLSYVGVISIPVFFIHFVVSFLQQFKYKLILPVYALGLVFQIFNFTPLFIKDAGPILSFRYYGTPGIIYPLFVISFAIITAYGIYILIRYFKKSEGQARNQIRYLLFATVIGFVGGGTGFLPNFNIEIFPFGFYLLSIYVVLVSYAITKHRLMDINIVLKKGTTYVLLMLLLFVPSILLIILSQKLFFKEINYLFSAIILSLLLLVAFFFHQIKPGTEKAVEYFLFKNKYDYRETLGKFSKAMVSILDLQSLSKRIIDTIAQTMGVEKASLFLMNEEKGGYVLQESRNIKMASQTPLLPKGDPLPRYLQKIGEIIVREELIKGANIPELKSVIEQMGLLGAEVSIPLILKGQLTGMINLSQKFDKDIYYHEDIELLSTLANQTAIAIENANLYEDLKKSKSYMRRTDRLASLGTLTAGLAHEIRNPLVAIKTFTQLLPERLEDEEFRSHFLNIASSEVDRISSLITELLEFARPSDPKMEFEDINSILDGMILLVSTETKKKQINIVKNYITNLPPIKIDREQIKQVFLNFLLNSIEATPERGEMTVKTRSFVKPGGEPYIQIEFTDNGRGIPAEHLEDIFTPFFTTKDKGSGLGLSISHQIVQDHRGYIDVESELNKGTSFFINLPLNQEYPKRRSEDLRNHQDIFNSFER